MASSSSHIPHEVDGVPLPDEIHHGMVPDHNLLSLLLVRCQGGEVVFACCNELTVPHQLYPQHPLPVAKPLVLPPEGQGDAPNSLVDHWAGEIQLRAEVSITGSIFPEALAGDVLELRQVESEEDKPGVGVTKADQVCGSHELGDGDQHGGGQLGEGDCVHGYTVLCHCTELL